MSSISVAPGTPRANGSPIQFFQDTVSSFGGILIGGVLVGGGALVGGKKHRLLGAVIGTGALYGLWFLGVKALQAAGGAGTGPGVQSPQNPNGTPSS